MQLPPSEKGVYKTFLSSLLRLQNVERGSIWVRQENEYLCIEALGQESQKVKGMRIRAGQKSIVGWVMEHGRMTIAHPAEDDRHYRQVETHFIVKSNLILAFPLKMKDGSVYGTVELIDTGVHGRTINLQKGRLELIENLVEIGSLALNHFIDDHIHLRSLESTRAAGEQPLEAAAIIGRNPKFLATLQKAREFSRFDFPVLITGESGTGKELLAREMHRFGTRSDRPYLVQTCSAIPDELLENELFGYRKGAFEGAWEDKTGLLERVHHGTVLLNEIGDLSPGLQRRLLEVLKRGKFKRIGGRQSRKVNVRIISATNSDLGEAIAEGQFLEELYHHLNVLPIYLPPLRDRKEDISLLLNYFMNRECRQLGIDSKRFDSEALERLTDYAWKGNVRELENTVIQMALTVAGETVAIEDLPPYIVHAAPDEPHPMKAGPAAPEPVSREDLMGLLVGRSWEDLNRDYALALLKRTRWNISKASRLAGLKRSTFVSRIRKLGIRK